jgi:hypothetical protein
MVNRRVSQDMKECALSLWDRGWEESTILDALNISRSSLYRWRRIFREFGAAVRPPSPIRDRTRIITSALMKDIHILYKSDPDTYLDEIQWWLAVRHDIAISIAAIHKNLADAGLTRKLLMKIARERDQQLRDDWREHIQALSSGTGIEFVFVDEASKNDHDTARRYGRAMVGERAEFVTFSLEGTATHWQLP